MIISRTPFRISFVGGGTDLRAFYSREFGRLLSTTIDKYIYIAVKKQTDIVDFKYRINWSKVEEILSLSDVLVAHNASFDRTFLEKNIDFENVWACSKDDINWKKRGFFNTKLELLSIWHGFYYDSHRAMNDVDALVHLLTHDIYSDNIPVLELIEKSMIPYYKISAIGSPFETKDKLKSRNYFWDSSKKCWWKRITRSEIEPEEKWLAENVYNGYFQGRIEEIAIIDKYKD